MEYHVRETDKTVRVTEYHGSRYFITHGVYRDILILMCLDIMRLGYAIIRSVYLDITGVIFVVFSHLGFHGIMIHNYTQRMQGCFLFICWDITYLGYHGPTIHHYFCCTWGYPEINFHRIGDK